MVERTTGEVHPLREPDEAGPAAATVGAAGACTGTGLTTSTSSAPSPPRDNVTQTRSPGACLRAFVSASWTMR
jgi:hypothetical protein